MKTQDNTRIGKIAALPLAVREEINQRILDGQLATQILPWLNDLPTARQVLAERFDGKPVLRQNLSHWRAGGYQEWLRARVHAADTSKLVDYTIKDAQARGVTLLESVSSMLAGQLLGVLSQMAEVMEGNEEGRMQNAEVGAECFGDRGRGGGRAREGCEAADKKMALVERRLGLLGKATASLARLRRGEQGQEALRLQGERVAVMVEGNRIKRDKMALEASRQAQVKPDKKVEEDARLRKRLGMRPQGGGASQEVINFVKWRLGFSFPEDGKGNAAQGGSSKTPPGVAEMPPEAIREIDEMIARL